MCRNPLVTTLNYLLGSSITTIHPNQSQTFHYNILHKRLNLRVALPVECDPPKKMQTQKNTTTSSGGIPLQSEKLQRDFFAKNKTYERLSANRKLFVWVGGLDSWNPVMKGIVMVYPDSNPKPPGPKPTINH